jgi:site-specific DNA-methyltransferase (cytosine-N4-specific)
MSTRILQGDCRDLLPTLAANSVHCAICSPPYWSLRDYGTATWEGGDPACDHTLDRRNERLFYSREDRPPGRSCTSWSTRDVSSPYFDTCGKCGARRIDKAIGLEATVDEWLSALVTVFRGVRRVLRDDGTCWVNLGDAYCYDRLSSPMTSDFSGTDGLYQRRTDYVGGIMPKRTTNGLNLKPKDLMMMPARLALALQADGWWLRSDIIWAKPNPMPESVTDRPTSAYEHIFLLTKQGRYFYDADAVRDGRNLRNVWSIGVEAFPMEHFATFPVALAARCIEAGTSAKGCCAQCGAPWVRETRPSARYAPFLGQGFTDHADDLGIGRMQNRGINRQNEMLKVGITSRETETIDWRPSCACKASIVPCIVLDPFAGAGTTLLAAEKLQRDGVGIELNPKYVTLARNRLDNPPPSDAKDDYPRMGFLRYASES